MQAYDSITFNKHMIQYFYINFIDFILKGKCLSEYTNSLSPNEYKRNEKIILKYFQ